MTNNESKKTNAHGNAHTTGRNAANHQNTTDAITKINTNPDAGNDKHSAPDPMRGDTDPPNAMREQLQDDDPAASKWKVAMIDGEGKGEDKPIAGLMQGMIFVIF